MSNHIVGTHALHKVMESNILKISQDARAAKAINPEVIDATVGMLHREDGKLFKYATVEEQLFKLSDPEMYFYAPVNGSKEFSAGVIDWVFGSNRETITKTFHLSVIPTTGGSGALSNSLYNFNDFGQSMLVPNYYWTPYENIAEEAHIGVKTFRLYDENYDFNIADFTEKANELAFEQKRLFLILNDPCNNPTGFCLTKENWQAIIKVLNDISRADIPVILLHDSAYIDYQMKEHNQSRDVYEAFLELDENILTIIAFSGSKTFSMYGFRIGAQLGMSKSKAIIDEFNRVGDYSVRARFSSVSRPAMSVIGKIFANQELKKTFILEIETAKDLLRKRIELFHEIAQRENLKMLPYGGGFFVGIETDNQNIFKDLVQDGVFIISMPGMIRIALSSVKLTEIERLVKIIKKHI
jgi:aspartate/tyrosine/aromatic aminotransferase